MIAIYNCHGNKQLNTLRTYMYSLEQKKNTCEVNNVPSTLNLWAATPFTVYYISKWL